MEIISRIGLIILKILSFIIGPWIYLVYFCKKKTIPPIIDPLLQIPASELVQMIQKKQVTKRVMKELCSLFTLYLLI